MLPPGFVITQTGSNHRSDFKRAKQAKWDGKGEHDIMVYFEDFLSRVPPGVDSDEALDTLVTFISEPNLRNSIDQMRREDRTVPLTGKDGLRLFLNDAADRYTRGHNDEDDNAAYCAGSMGGGMTV